MIGAEHERGRGVVLDREQAAIERRSLARIAGDRIAVATELVAEAELAIENAYLAVAQAARDSEAAGIEHRVRPSVELAAAFRERNRATAPAVLPVDPLDRIPDVIA